MADCPVPGCNFYNIYKSTQDGSYEYQQKMHAEEHENGTWVNWVPLDDADQY